MSFLDVKALDIKRWSAEPSAPYHLPELIRRLIFATTPTLEHIDFPIGASVNSGGWDGTTTVTTGTTYVPSGVCGWELGKTPGVKGKADKDYAERVKNSLGLKPVETTFIFVTPQTWTAKKKWVTEKEKDKHWKEVRALNADDLESWLSQSPAVQVWFSRLIGKRFDGLTDLDTYWQDWMESTVPPTPSQLVLAGRSRTSADVQVWLQGTSLSLTLQADSREEAMAVFTASLMQLPAADRDRYLVQAVVVTTLEAWRQLIEVGTQLLLIPLFEERDEIAGAYRRRHRVFIPSSPTDAVSSDTEPIPRIAREVAERALQAQGLSYDKAYALAWTARTSFASFRRKLAISPSLQRPIWAKPENAFSLIPALLLGAWDENEEKDREAVAHLAQLPYEQVQQGLLRWANETNPPVRLTSSTWYVSDKLDVWSLLYRFITRDQLNRLQQLVIDILGAPLPRYELPIEHQYRAELLDKRSPYSKVLRDSIANTLALIGSQDEQSLPAANITARSFASYTVTLLLRQALANPLVLRSISDLLPALAEAAPDPFLQEIHIGLTGEDPVVMTLFEEQPGLFHASSHHAGLLWALETLAWKPEYLGYVFTILTRLTQLDPGGSTTNRPRNTLREIFLLWHPNTTAPLDQRLTLLRQLVDQAPEIGRSLLMRLLPEFRGVAENTAKPRWRDWPTTVQPTRGDVARGGEEIGRLLMKLAGSDVTQWQSLIVPLVEHASPTVFKEAIARLIELSNELTSDHDKALIWHILRQLVHRHRSHSDTEWAMWREQTDALAELLPRFEPIDIVERYAWLFDQWPALPEGQVEDEDYEALIEQTQYEALQQMHVQGDDHVLALIPTVSNAFYLGRAFAKTGLSDSRIEELLGRYLAETRSEDLFARGIADHWLRHKDRDRDWCEAVAERSKNSWSAAQLAEWFTFLKNDVRTWTKLSDYEGEVEQQYWDQFVIWGIDDVDAEQATRLLLQFNHPFKAVELLSLHEKKGGIPTQLILEALEKLYDALTPEVARQLRSYQVSILLDRLASDTVIDRISVGQLEFKFLPLTYSYREGSTTVLHKQLASSPQFFAELLSKVYKKTVDGKVVDEPVADEQDANNQDAAASMSYFQLLNSFRAVPGLGEDNYVDQDFLFTWVTEAKQALSEMGRLIIGEQQIGQMLSSSPEGDDKYWPHEAVRNLLEHEASVELEKGFEIGVTNSRGSTSRGVYEGGRQERDLVELYAGYAEVIAPTWPRTGAILRGLAGYYRRMAAYEDGEADRNQDLWR
ncbi:hypothetical protein FNT36_20735 [Hymenobacter setariae]|uniref:Uncharacterized protein n=1 Tax=Hymenobacter setariae TaxID=2594794 RepID=A0A558BQ32_9BACT|nr:hypothetical protein [Hymenobacter setariae]TVT38608.1 hypothetical protein FNT36_20735 [Hymenobacter setariae]